MYSHPNVHGRLEVEKAAITIQSFHNGESLKNMKPLETGWFVRFVNLVSEPLH